jgi:hypothetical protein
LIGDARFAVHDHPRFPISSHCRGVRSCFHSHEDFCGWLRLFLRVFPSAFIRRYLFPFWRASLFMAARECPPTVTTTALQAHPRRLHDASLSSRPQSQERHATTRVVGAYEKQQNCGEAFAPPNPTLTMRALTKQQANGIARCG